MPGMSLPIGFACLFDNVFSLLIKARGGKEATDHVLKCILDAMQFWQKKLMPTKITSRSRDSNPRLAGQSLGRLKHHSLAYE